MGYFFISPIIISIGNGILIVASNLNFTLVLVIISESVPDK